jgi:hypothetical protein
MSGRRAVCVDLPMLARWNFGAGHLRLGPGATTLQVRIDGSVRAAIDTRTFAVSSGVPVASPVPTQPASHDSRASGGGGGLPWELVVLPIAVLAAFGAAVWRHARPRAT